MRDGERRILLDQPAKRGRSLTSSLRSFTAIASACTASGGAIELTTPARCLPDQRVAGQHAVEPREGHDLPLLGRRLTHLLGTLERKHAC
jgi:hypothetical protein